MGWPGKLRLASWRSSGRVRRLRGDSANEQELQAAEMIVAGREEVRHEAPSQEQLPQRRLHTSSADVVRPAAMDLDG